MILKALYDYYQLLKANDPNLPEVGFKQQEIHFVIVVDKEGNLVRVEDRRIDNKTAQSFKVIADARSSGIKPYLFYDNLEYVSGHPKDQKVEKAMQRHKAFVEKCKEISAKYPDNAGFKAVVLFYDKEGAQRLKETKMWEAMVGKTGANISFLLEGEEHLVASSADLSNELDFSVPQSGSNAVCLITGEKCKPVELTTATMIPGSHAKAKLVAFQENSGYDSYGKTKCYNAPISKTAESAYSNALLRLLGKNSKNKFLLGSRTFVFWANSNSQASTALEESLYLLFSSSDPNKNIEMVRDCFNAIYSGKLPAGEYERFYILGLAPNTTRIAVVYWQDISIRDFAAKLLQHFVDMEICDTHPNSKSYCGLHQMMAATTISRKASDATPNLPEATIKSIFEGMPYPYTLYTAALRRIRAELDKNEGLDRYFTKIRIAILKAYINRNTKQQKLTTMLDTTSTNAGYLCGRLFAVLVYAQQKASNIDSIKARYMNSASSTPAAVFGTLLNLSIHHTDKLDRGKGYIEKLKDDIINLLPASGFPAHLSLQDQGRFFVGYYQQTNALWTKKTNDTENNNPQ